MSLESALQSYLITLAKKCGVYARKVAAVGHTGFPDVFLAHGGQVILVEVKSPTGKGRLSKKQEHELGLLDSVGVPCFVISSRGEADNVIDRITNG